MPKKVNKMWTSPSKVDDGDWCALKVVAVAGYMGDWAAYYGPSDWSDEEVNSNGTKMTEKEAAIFAYLFQLRTYRA